jgi:hypothetical protein
MPPCLYRPCFRAQRGPCVTNIPSPFPPKLTEHALLEQRERAAADVVKVLALVKAEIARARALLDRIGREQSVDPHQHKRHALVAPRLDPQLGSTLFEVPKS